MCKAAYVNAFVLLRTCFMLRQLLYFSIKLFSHLACRYQILMKSFNELFLVLGDFRHYIIHDLGVDIYPHIKVLSVMLLTHHQMAIDN